AGALSALHGRGILHRDIKPSNVLLVGGAPEAATLLDLGIARYADATRRMTQTGSVIGTPGYMSPEQARADHDLDPRADVFSLGCVLFECLAGRAAFAGEHAIAILARILLEDAQPPSQSRPGLPRALDELVLRMLAKDRANRPPSAAAV